MDSTSWGSFPPWWKRTSGFRTSLETSEKEFERLRQEVATPRGESDSYRNEREDVADALNKFMNEMLQLVNEVAQKFRTPSQRSKSPSSGSRPPATGPCFRSATARDARSRSPRPEPSSGRGAHRGRSPASARPPAGGRSRPPAP